VNADVRQEDYSRMTDNQDIVGGYIDDRDGSSITVSNKAFLDPDRAVLINRTSILPEILG